MVYCVDEGRCDANTLCSEEGSGGLECAGSSWRCLAMVSKRKSAFSTITRNTEYSVLRCLALYCVASSWNRESKKKWAISSIP